VCSILCGTSTFFNSHNTSSTQHENLCLVFFTQFPHMFQQQVMKWIIRIIDAEKNKAWQSNTNLPSRIGPFHSLMGDVGIFSKSLNICIANILKLQQQDKRQHHYTTTLSRLKLHIIYLKGRSNTWIIISSKQKLPQVFNFQVWENIFRSVNNNFLVSNGHGI
jgi:hypothetical protein